MYCGRGAVVGILWGSASISGAVGAGFAGKTGRVKVSGGVNGFGDIEGAGVGIMGFGVSAGAGVGDVFLKSTISGAKDVGSLYLSTGFAGVGAVSGAIG